MSILVMFILLQFTDNETIKMAIIVGCSMVFLTLQSLTFTVPYCAKIIQCKTGALYWVFIQSVLCVAISCVVCFLMSKVFVANTWLKLICSGAIVCAVGAVVGLFVILGKEERQSGIAMIKKMIRRKKEDK